jgi:hypothetical protein
MQNNLVKHLHPDRQRLETQSKVLNNDQSSLKNYEIRNGGMKL